VQSRDRLPRLLRQQFSTRLAPMLGHIQHVLIGAECAPRLAAYPSCVGRSIAKCRNSEIAGTSAGKRLPDDPTHTSTGGHRDGAEVGLLSV